MTPVDTGDRLHNHAVLPDGSSPVALLTAIIEALPPALVMIDGRGRIALVNRGAEKLFGYSRCELLGRPLEILVPTACRERHAALRAAYSAMPRPRRMGEGRHLYGIRKNGNEFPVEIGLNPIQTENGLYVLAAMIDITVRTGLEQRVQQHVEELRHANDAIERSNRALQQFAYIASHDLQTPLRSIAGFAQLLRSEYEGRLDGQADDWIRRIVDSAKQMQELIHDLLEPSRPGSQARPFRPVRFREVFDHAVSILGSSIDELGARVVCDDLPIVTGDRSQLVQLMQNLIGNSLKYHGHAPPDVRVSARREGDEWVFAVRDNGIGIDPAHREQIFEMFQRLHDNQKYPGTGIGLAVCRGVVERHGGRIWVEAEPGGGSVFHFTIPLTTANAP